MPKTSRKQPTEAALRESEAKFQTLMETASVAIVVVDARGQIELVNRRMEEMFGYAREEVIGQVLEMLLPERYRHSHVQHRQGYMDDPHTRAMGVDMSLAGRRKDGGEFPVEIGLSYIRTDEGLLTMSFITDISERKRAEEALQQYARRLESMQEVDRAILAARSSEETARVALGHLRHLIPDLQSSVILFDYPTGRARVLTNEQGPATPHRLTLDEAPPNLATLQAGQPTLATCPPTEGPSDGGRAYLDAPLLAQEDLIGVLRLEGPAPIAFTGEQVEIAREVANQVAIALRQAQLREDLEQYAADLEARVIERTHEIERRREVAEGLRDILTTLNSDRSLEEILDYIVALAGRLLGTDATALYEGQGAEQPLRIVAARGLSPEYVAMIRIAPGEGAVGRAVRERHPIAITDVTTLLPDPAAPPSNPTQHALLLDLARRYRSLLAVPLTVKEEVYGCVVLYYAATHHFSRDEIDLAVAFADQAALAIENARLRAQVEESAVAAERNRLARDLHDAVTQTLFAASLIADVLPRLWERNPDEGRRRLEELRQLTRGALAEMRTLLFELRPAALAKSDLGDLLRQLAEAAAGRGRVPVAVEVTGYAPLPPEVQVALYRIAQEALNNVAKHAQAQHATVRLALESPPTGTRLRLSVQDDGRGFDLGAIPPKCLGLDIMHERTADIGARLALHSQPGAGTMVIVTWEGRAEERDL